MYERTPHTSAAGFTLVEAMITVVILALAAAVAFPKIQNMTTHMRVDDAATLVAHDLETAQSNAARERDPMVIQRGSDHQSITVTDRVSNTVLFTRHLGKTDVYALDSVAFSTSPVDIFPNGWTSSALTITLYASGWTRQVTMSQAGWVRTK